MRMAFYRVVKRAGELSVMTNDELLAIANTYEDTIIGMAWHNHPDKTELKRDWLVTVILEEEFAYLFEGK